MSWEVAVTRKTQFESRAPRVYVSMNKRGEIALNAEAWRSIREPWSVTLLWDEKRRRIGVKFPVVGEKEFFPVRNYGRGGRMRVVRATRLLKQFGINVERTLIFRDVEMEIFDGVPMLILELDNGSSIAR